MCAAEVEVHVTVIEKKHFLSVFATFMYNIMVCSFGVFII